MVKCDYTLLVPQNDKLGFLLKFGAANGTSVHWKEGQRPANLPQVSWGDVLVGINMIYVRTWICKQVDKYIFTHKRQAKPVELMFVRVSSISPSPSSSSSITPSSLNVGSGASSDAAIEAALEVAISCVKAAGCTLRRRKNNLTMRWLYTVHSDLKSHKLK